MAMRYIDNYELREWVKESLKRTIFQKAHALAIQTGCDILVKLQDRSATTCHQSYATGPLQKAYNNNALRREADEKSVSGDTGLPLMDSAVQSDISQVDTSTEELVGSMGAVGDLVANQTFSSQNEMTTEYSNESDNTMMQDTAVPMHITSVSTNSHVATSTVSTMSQAQQFENDPDDIDTTEVQIKQEPIEVDEISEISEETDTKPLEEEGQQAFDSNQELAPASGLPIFVQTPVPSSSITRYSVPMSPKPYQCGVCQKAFRSVHVLQKHTQTFHTKPHIKLAPRRGRGRGSHYLNRPAHQVPQTSTFPVFPGGGADPTPMTTQPSLQDIPGTSQQIAHMAQMASTSQFPTTTPIAAPAASDFSPAGPIFQSPPPGPSTISTPVQQQQQAQGSGRPTLLELITPYFKSPGKEAYKPPSGVPIIDIQHQVLKSPGPVVTLRSFTDNAPMRLRKINLAEFLRAISGLREYGDIHLLGEIPGLKGSITVFVKKIPEQMSDCNLCPMVQYTKRYYIASPRAIGLGLKNELITTGLVTKEQLDGVYNVSTNAAVPVSQ